MNLKAKASYIVCGLVLMGLNAPQAMANGGVTLGTLSVPNAAINISDNGITTGSFVDVYTFQVAATADASATFTSSFTTKTFSATGPFSPFNKVELTEIVLLDTTSKTTVEDVVLTTAQNNYQYLGTLGTAYRYSDSASFTGATLLQNHTYSLEVIGQGGTLLSSTHQVGSYIGSLSLVVAPPAGGAPVPEPEAWAMLLLGLPLLGWVVRRKQGV